MIVQETVHRCTTCKTINDEDARYCKHCGEKAKAEIGLDNVISTGALPVEDGTSKMCKKCGGVLFGGTCWACDRQEILYAFNDGLD